MIRDLLSEWGSHLKERLSNPVLGPFSAFWLAWNWRLVSVLIYSRVRIEDRIDFIDENFVNVWDILVIPAALALVYALSVPWLSLWIQNAQDKANTRRRKNRLTQETEVLRASVDRAEAQATLNKILAQDEITRRQQEEIASMKQELESQKENAEARVAEAQAEFERKREEYEEQADKRTADAKRLKDELQNLEMQLKKEQVKAQSEVDRMRNEISQKERRLDFNLRTTPDSRRKFTDAELMKVLVSKRYRLFHNPSVGPQRSKLVTFSSSGDVKEGANDNEHKWRIRNGLFEFIQKDGEIHSRFQYLPDSYIFVHTGDEDTKSARGQFMIPEPLT